MWNHLKFWSMSDTFFHPNPNTVQPIFTLIDLELSWIACIECMCKQHVATWLYNIFHSFFLFFFFKFIFEINFRFFFFAFSSNSFLKSIFVFFLFFFFKSIFTILCTKLCLCHRSFLSGQCRRAVVHHHRPKFNFRHLRIKKIQKLDCFIGIFCF